MKTMVEIITSRWLYRFLLNIFYFVFVLLCIQNLQMNYFYMLFILSSIILMVINIVCDYREIIDELDEVVQR